jgi:hypothetical protein
MRDMKGENNPFFGKKHSIETKEKIRKKTLEQLKKGHPCWGKTRDTCNYASVHKYISRRKKPEMLLCEQCDNEPAVVLHNILKTYSRNPEDYIALCDNCHFLYEEGLGNHKRDQETGKFLKKVMN